jgi:hypothetical protein
VTHSCPYRDALKRLAEYHMPSTEGSLVPKEMVVKALADADSVVDQIGPLEAIERFGEAYPDGES